MSELVAKTVFGEMSLGEVFKKFEKKISSVVVETNGSETNCTAWRFLEDRIQFGQVLPRYKGSEVTGEWWNVELELLLNSKVKVKEDFLEIGHKGDTFILTFIESKNIRFDALLP